MSLLVLLLLLLDRVRPIVAAIAGAAAVRLEVEDVREEEVEAARASSC